MSVEPRPEASTSAPCEAAPRPNASASGPEDARMSCTVTIFLAPVTWTNAAPTASATPSSSWSGTTPLMSYAFTILARSPIPPPVQLAVLTSLSVLGRSGLQHPQVTATAYLDALADWLLGSFPRPVVHHRVGERLQAIRPVLAVARIDRQPHHIPAARRCQPGSVLFTQVVTMRFHVGGQRAEHRRGIPVHVRQCVNRGMFARGARAATGTHRPTSLTYGMRARSPACVDTPLTLSVRGR